MTRINERKRIHINTKKISPENLLPPCGGGLRWGEINLYSPPPSPSPIKGEGGCGKFSSFVGDISS